METINDVGEYRLVVPGHLADAEAHIAAIHDVVITTGFREQHQAQVELVGQVLYHADQGAFLVIKRRIPVGGIVHVEEDIGALRFDVRVDQEDVRVVVYRVEDGQQRRGE